MGLIEATLSETSTTALESSLHDLLTTLQLPSRAVIRGTGIRYINNLAWTWDANDPAATENDQDSEFSQRWALSDQPLTQFRIATAKFAPASELQIAVPIDFRPADNLDAYLLSMFRILKQIGFRRMRYYRRRKAPGSPGILSLVRSFGEPSIDATVAWARSWRKQTEDGVILYTPLEGVLAERFHQYDFKRRPEKFIFKTFQASEFASATAEASNDYWTRVARLDGGDTCLEFPIICEVAGRSAPRYEARAIVVADNKIEGQPATVVAEAVSRRGLSLRAHCVEIGRLLERDYAQEREDARERARRFIVSSAPPSGDSEAFDKYSETLAHEARLVAGCDVAIVCWKPETASAAYVKAVSVSAEALASYPQVHRLKNRLVVDDILPVLATCVRERRPRFEQDGRDWPVREGISLSEARIALPLTIGGRIVGAIGFADRRPRRFTQRRVSAVQDLIDLAALVLEHLGAASTAHRWQSTLAHEVLDQANAIRKALMARSDIGPDDGQLMRARWRVDVLLSSCAALQGVRSKPQGFKDTIFSPSVYLTEELGRAQTVGEDYLPPKMFCMRPLQDTHVKLRTSYELFGYVLRTLVENAMRHGSTPRVEILEELIAGHWRLTLVNDGHMSPEQDKFKYEPLVVLPDSKGGSHSGLAQARRWAEDYGATLSVFNSCRQTGDACPCRPQARTVTATLTWPLFQERTS